MIASRRCNVTGTKPAWISSNFTKLLWMFKSCEPFAKLSIRNPLGKLWEICLRVHKRFHVNLRTRFFDGPFTAVAKIEFSIFHGENWIWTFLWSNNSQEFSSCFELSVVKGEIRNTSGNYHYKGSWIGGSFISFPIRGRCEWAQHWHQ